MNELKSALYNSVLFVINIFALYSYEIMSVVVVAPQKKMNSQELTLEIHIMPCKRAVTVSLKMNDTIATMKQRISVPLFCWLIIQECIGYPADEMKIINAGRVCADNSTDTKNGLNYCSRVICIAKNYVQPEDTEPSGSVMLNSKLLIKMDGSNSYNVPYNAATTWRQLKITLQVIDL